MRGELTGRKVAGSRLEAVVRETGLLALHETSLLLRHEASLLRLHVLEGRPIRRRTGGHKLVETRLGGDEGVEETLVGGHGLRGLASTLLLRLLKHARLLSLQKLAHVGRRPAEAESVVVALGCVERGAGVVRSDAEVAHARVERLLGRSERRRGRAILSGLRKRLEHA